MYAIGCQAYAYRQAYTVSRKAKHTSQSFVFLNFGHRVYALGKVHVKHMLTGDITIFLVYAKMSLKGNCGLEARLLTHLYAFSVYGCLLHTTHTHV